MREAAELLRAYPHKDRDHYLDIIEAPYEPRIERRVREALRSSPEPTEQVAAVIEVIVSEGLQVPEAVEPLPEIGLDDIHVVCWMALTRT